MKDTLDKLLAFEKELFKEDIRKLTKRNKRRLQNKYLKILSNSMKKYRKSGMKLFAKKTKVSAATLIFLVGEK
jgi:hypothetical protein